MAHVTPTLNSVFCEKSAAASWSKSKLEDDHRLSRLFSKYWGKDIDDEAKQWRESHSTVKDNPTNEIGPKCYGLDLGTDIKCSQMWVRQDYIRMYDYCIEWHQEVQSSKLEGMPSVVITGQPGIGVFLSSVASSTLSNNPSCEKVKHIGSHTLSVVVLENRCHSFGI
jgi:hypothetical protein